MQNHVSTLVNAFSSCNVRIMPNRHLRRTDVFPDALPNTHHPTFSNLLCSERIRQVQLEDQQKVGISNSRCSVVILRVRQGYLIGALYLAHVMSLHDFVQTFPPGPHPRTKPVGSNVGICITFSSCATITGVSHRYQSGTSSAQADTGHLGREDSYQ